MNQKVAEVFDVLPGDIGSTLFEFVWQFTNRHADDLELANNC